MECKVAHDFSEGDYISLLFEVGRCVGPNERNATTGRCDRQCWTVFGVECTVNECVYVWWCLTQCSGLKSVWEMTLKE